MNLSGCVVVQATGEAIEEIGDSIKEAAIRESGGYQRTAPTPADEPTEFTQHETTDSDEHVYYFRKDIMRAQAMLNAQGYRAGKEDGLMGSKTRAAISEFQRDHGLAVTGALNDVTYRQLEQSAASGGGADAKTEVSYISNDITGPAREESIQEQPSTPKREVIRISADTEMMQSPDAFSSAVASLRKGVKVIALEKSGNWYKVEHEGRIGYVYSEFVQE